MISVKGLKKRFGRLQVLKGINLNIEKPGIYAILGPNGSGKTTMIKCLLGLTIPTDGEIIINDDYVLAGSTFREDVGYLPQVATFPENLKVSELITLVKKLRKLPSREEALIAHFGIEEYLDSKLGHLSGGTKQKINVILTFMFDSDIYFLDEPSAGLDPVSMIKLKELILKERDKGKTILITTHIMSLVEEFADSVIFILEGEIFFSGTTSEMMQKYKENKLEKAIATILQMKSDD